MSHVVKNKPNYHLSQIMSKCHCIFTENFAIFFQMQGELETCRNSNLTSFGRTSFEGDINETFIS